MRSNTEFRLERTPANFPRRTRFLVIGRNHNERHEIGYFTAATPYEACSAARRQRGHLCGGLKLEASEA